MEINVLEIDEMNSQVDSNGDDCMDYKKLAGNINKTEESPILNNENPHINGIEIQKRERYLSSHELQISQSQRSAASSV